jgi:hypothetical protein
VTAVVAVVVQLEVRTRVYVQDVCEGRMRDAMETRTVLLLLIEGVCMHTRSNDTMQ